MNTTPRRIIEIVAFAVVVLIAALSLHAWLASHDEQQRLTSMLTAQKQVIDAADAREHANAAALSQTLVQIDKLKRAAQTPEEILRSLPKYLALPQPITLAPAAKAASAARAAAAGQKKSAPESPRQGTALPEISAAPASPSTAASLPPSASQPDALPSAASAPSPAAQIPVADLKPLYDYVQDCRACQAQLAAAKQTRADDAATISALTMERDAAITEAKGGTFWRRLRRNALWFAVGAGVGATAHYAAANR